MSSLNTAQAPSPFPFNYFVDTEMLSIVLAKEIYVIPFQKAHAAFDAVRKQMIDTNAFNSVSLHRHVPAGTKAIPTGLQLLKHYQHLIVNHPSREVPSAEQPSSQVQFRKRSRLLDQIFSRVIGSIYARGVGRPPRKYDFDDQLDLMLLEQVLQHKAHLRPRSQLNSTFSVIRQGIIVSYGFASDHTVPAPATVEEGAPTIPQLTVRYQYLIAAHVNPSAKEEPDQHPDPDSARKRSHLLDIIVRDIVTQALSGSDLLRKTRRSSLEAPENDAELSAPRQKRRKSYPSVESPLPEPTLRTRDSPAAKVLMSRPGFVREAEAVKNRYMVVEKAKENQKPSQPEPENESVWWRRMEERRLALEEEQQKKNWKLAVLEEQRMKIEEQRLKIQEKTLAMVQEEHKVLTQTLSGLASVFSKVAEKLCNIDPKGDFNSTAQVGAVDMPGSCDLAPVDTAILPEELVVIDETPMDVEQTLREPMVNEKPAEEKPPEEDEVPVDRQATVGSVSAVTSNPPMQDGSPKGTLTRGKKPHKASRPEVVKEISSKETAAVNKATGTAVSTVRGGPGAHKDSEVGGDLAAVSGGNK